MIAVTDCFDCYHSFPLRLKRLGEVRGMAGNASEEAVKRGTVPARKAAALHHHVVVAGVLEEIMEDKFLFRVFPADDLSKAQVVEYKGVAPFFNGVELLGELNQPADFQRGRSPDPAAGRCAGKTEVAPGYRCRTGAVTNKIARITPGHKPEPVLKWRRGGEIPGIPDSCWRKAVRTSRSMVSLFNCSTGDRRRAQNSQFPEGSTFYGDRD